MNWKSKALLQRWLSRCPFGYQVNYLLQRFVQKSLPIDNAGICKLAEIATFHLEAFARQSSKEIDRALFLEIGAGTDLALPLLLYAYGVDRQFTLDIMPLARRFLVNSAVAGVCALDLPLRRRPTATIAPSEALRTALRSNYGIEYLAPLDARHTRLTRGFVDFLHSTNTMEHIPPADLSLILKECHQLLAPAGVLSLYIDYRDHYSYTDGKISVFNFLTYSDSLWARYNCLLQYQNRLRHCDYLALIDSCEFRVVEERRITPSEPELKMLDGLDVDGRFRGYSRNDLAITGSHLVLVHK
jgi:SAM-dependent methyltransferase